MRNRVRIQPYISPELRHRLAAYSAAQDVTESAIAEAALTKYLEPDGADDALVVRRLDAVVQALGRVEAGLEIIGEAVGRFVRTFYAIAPDKVAPGAISRGEERFRTLISGISTAVGTGTTFVAAVRRARVTSAAVPGSAAEGGQ